ncbi:hypothetical protein Syun_029744 [Stephania yunnanensis]|uniref:Uncharacterized protein n=1 Tax=Stephania yunnanensis TaxID=152371 RepID=A0AAP0E8J5_9MAGN
MKTKRNRQNLKTLHLLRHTHQWRSKGLYYLNINHLIKEWLIPLHKGHNAELNPWRKLCEMEYLYAVEQLPEDLPRDTYCKWMKR